MGMEGDVTSNRHGQVVRFRGRSANASSIVSLASIVDLPTGLVSFGQWQVWLADKDFPLPNQGACGAGCVVSDALAATRRIEDFACQVSKFVLEWSPENEIKKPYIRAAYFRLDSWVRRRHPLPIA